MEKKQQLYIKNDKGRYEPYEPPKVNVSENLYQIVCRVILFSPVNYRHVINLSRIFNFL